MNYKMPRERSKLANDNLAAIIELVTITDEQFTLACHYISEGALLQNFIQTHNILLLQAF